jgi:NAD(P)H-flavin reductase
LAPFRAFLHERRSAGDSEQTTLYFGCRSEHEDYIYREELESYAKTVSFLSTTFCWLLNMIILPRQARDNHTQEGKLRKGCGFVFWIRFVEDKTLAALHVAFSRCEKQHLFLSFPYVCSEPVLAK